jgi:hypothetical protein
VGDTEQEIANCSIGSNPRLKKGGRFLAPTSSFGPFGGGSGLCPGRRFARNELKATLVMLFSCFDIALAPNSSSSSNNNKGGLVEVDGSRAGLGIFPPKDKSMQLVVTKKQQQQQQQKKKTGSK